MSALHLRRQCLPARAGCRIRWRGAETGNGKSTVLLNLAQSAVSATAFKMVGLYGRNADQLGVSTTYLSCGGQPVCNGN